MNKMQNSELAENEVSTGFHGLPNIFNGNPQEETKLQDCQLLPKIATFLFTQPCQTTKSLTNKNSEIKYLMVYNYPEKFKTSTDNYFENQIIKGVQPCTEFRKLRFLHL